MFVRFSDPSLLTSLESRPNERCCMRTIKTIVALALVFLLAASFIGCNKNAPDTQVAATVNGVDILESDVTKRIDSFRLDQTTGEPLDDTAWAQMLKSANYTPESLREFVIRNQFASYVLLLQRAEAEGITPDAALVDQDLADVKASVEGQGSTWEEYLNSMGYASEEAYRQVLDAQNVIEPLLEKVLPDVTPTQAEIETYVSENAAYYAGKRLSVIYFPLDETNTLEIVQPKAEEALAKINEGTDFADVAAEYIADSSLASTGGDLGWGQAGSLPAPLKEASDALEIGGVSDVIVIQDDTIGTNAIFILKVTDDFVLPEAEAELEASENESEETTAQPELPANQIVDYALVPADLAELLAENYTSTKKSEAETSYFTDLIESDEIVVNPMPEGLSYNVDMTLADTPATEETETPQPEQPASIKWDAPAPIFTEDGLGISDVSEGTGAEAVEGSTVEVHYTGYLEDGTVFDSSVGGAPYSVVIGQSSVIQGWHLGLVGMKVGGKRQITIPPELAYGANGQGSIPPNATLIFDLELVSVDGNSTGYASAGSEASEDSEVSEGQPSANGQ
jgi:parvulin-like peptidyl-prolyl isomerase